MTKNHTDLQFYAGKTIHLVHPESIQKVAEGKKPADQADVNTARVILKRIRQLQDAGVTIKIVNNPSLLEHSIENNEQVIVAGAFDGQ